MSVKIINIEKIIPHEQIIPNRLKEVKEKISLEKIIDFPIIIDKNTKTIIDWHHRYNACLELGIKKIPVFMVEYLSNNVKVEPFRIWEKISKKIILEYSKNRKLFPAKTTKHSYNFKIYPINYKIKNI